MVKPQPFLKRVSLRRDDVPSFDDYPFAIPAVRFLDELVLHPQVTFFVGENGTGKSTLLEAIAVAEGFNPEGGSRNFTVSTRDSHSELFTHLKFERGFRRLRRSDGYFFRAESYFNVATEIERLDDIPTQEQPKIIKSYGGCSLHEQSHGESFWSLVSNRFGGDGFYLLDEPEAALSPSRQLSFLTALHDKVNDGSQFIIATHSPIIMAYPNAWIYTFSESQIKRVKYEDTEHYKVTKAFMNRTEPMLDELLREE